MKRTSPSIVHYEVTAIVHDDLVAAWERYLPGHVKDVLATGCFLEAAIEHGDAGHYRCRYAAAGQPVLERYLAEHAPALRAHVLGRFPQGIEFRRAVWTEWLQVAP